MNDSAADTDCTQCGESPCHRVTYADMLRSAGDAIDAETPPNTARRTLYRNYIGAVHGYLGRGNRVAVPVCVRNLIREMFPDPAGGYMGHMVAEGIEEFDG